MTRVATGEVFIGLNDEEVSAGLKRIDREFDRTMDKIEKAKATATVDADLGPLNDAIANSKRQLKQLEAVTATPGIELDEKDAAKLKASIERVKADLKRLSGAKATVELQVKGEENVKRAAAAAQKAVEDGIDAVNKKELAKAKLAEQLSKQQLTRVRQESRVRESLNAQRVRELSTAEREARQREAELRQVPKLERSYVALHDRIQDLAKAKRLAGNDEVALFRVQVEENDALAEIEQLKQTLRERTGRDPIVIPVAVEPGKNTGARLREMLLRNNGQLLPVGMEIGAAVGVGINRGIRRQVDRGLVETIRAASTNARAASSGVMNSVAVGGVSMLNRIGNAVGSLADASVRLGPFTTSIRGAAIGLSVLGPLLVDVVGTLGALAGSVGAAAIGTGALGTAIIGGGIPAFLGMGLVIKQVVGEFKDVAAAQKAYDDAVQKGNTDLAKKKMTELRKVMGNVSEETVKMVGKWDSVQAAFRSGTAGARGSVWNTIGEGIKTASALMPMFARNTTTAMAAASKGVNGWLKALRSDAGSGALDEMMQNFSKSITPALNGLGDLMGYLGRVGQIASRSLPGLARGFENWANKLNSVDTSTLEGKVNRVIDSAKNMGRFFMSAGRFVKAFFGAGVEAGDGLISTMTQALNRWTAFINSAEGNKKFGEFFNEAADGARTLYGFVAPLAAGFVGWAAALSPIARGFFSVMSVLSEFVAALGRVAGMQGALSALGVTLGALWAIGKIKTATMAVSGFTAALLGLSRAQGAVAAGNAASAISGAGRAATAAGAAAGARATMTRAGSSMPMVIPGAVAGSMDKTAASAAKMTGRMAGLRAGAGVAITALTGLNPVVGGIAIASIAAGVGIYKLANRVTSTEKAVKNAAVGFAQYRDNLAQMTPGYAAAAQASTQFGQAELTTRAAQREVNALRRAGKTGTDEYRMAVLNLRGAQQQEAAAETQVKVAVDATRKTRLEALKGAQKNAEMSRKALDSIGDKKRGLFGEEIGKQFEKIRGEAQKSGKSIREQITEAKVGPGTKADLMQMADLFDANARASGRLRDAQNQNALAILNSQRAAKGLVPIAQGAAKAFGQLARSMPRTAQTIALKFTGAGEAARVASSAARSLRAGVPKTVTSKIVADSGSATEAVRRLQNARINDKTLTILTKGGSTAIQTLEDIIGRKLTTKEQRIAEKGGSGVLSRLSEIGGRDLKGKIQQIREQGGGNVLGMVGSIISRIGGLRGKNVTIGANDNATGVIGRIKGAIAGVVGKTVSIITNFVQRGKKGADGGMFAAGGSPSIAQDTGSGAVPDARKQERALRTAELSGNPRKARSGKVTKPTLLVGEESTPEYVISTNPKYRGRNKEYVKAAARTLGMRGRDFEKKKAAGEKIDAFAGGGATAYSGGVNKTTGAYQASGNLGNAPSMKSVSAAPKKKPKKLTKGFKSKTKAAASSAHGYVEYIAGLQVAQEDWERTAQQREGAVREPEDFVKEVGRITAPDGTDLGPRIAVDQEAITAYQAQLKPVAEAVQQVVKIIQTLIAEIPKALTAIQNAINFRTMEMSLRQGNIGEIKQAINFDKKVIDNNSSGKQTEAKKDTVAKYKARLRQDEARLESQEKAREAAKEDRGKLTEDKTTLQGSFREAGFDLVDATADYGKIMADYFGVQGKASEEAQASNNATTASGAGVTPSAGGDGAGGAGDGGSGATTPEGPPVNTLTLDQQGAAANNEKANVLQAFGANMGPAAGVMAPGGGTPGINGAQGNPAGLGGGGVAADLTAGRGAMAGGGVAADLTAGRTAMRSSGAAAGAVASGSAAMTAGAAGGAAGTTVNNIKNVTIPTEYKETPEDVHTYARGVEHEINALL